mmetsp:Transcript_29326/g.63119  ORF Transcript_29326/g.63119 Transcript_29326/m.63119 type:complete len:1167 (+) Transcript_29326:178-3678(+)
MAGWDDDDDLLDAMLDDDDDNVVDSVSIVATSATTMCSNVAANDDDDAGERNDIVGGGWDDDLDLDGLSSDDNENDDGVGRDEGGGELIHPPPSPLPSLNQPQKQEQKLTLPPASGNCDIPHAAALGVADPMEEHGSNNNLDTAMEKTLTFQEHEDLMNREIKTIGIDQSLVQGCHGDIMATVGDNVDAEEEWDFDEDDDIFNDDNDALDVEKDGDAGTRKEEATTVLSEKVPKRAPPSTSPPPAAAYFIPLQKDQQPSENPFLLSENNKEENYGPALIPAAKSFASDNINQVNHDDGNGWSDDDFFDDDDDILSSSSKPISPTPVAPLSHTFPSAALDPPAAQSAWAKNTSLHQHHQLPPAAPPKPSSPVPAIQPTNIAAFNPTQRRIYQMLSKYISTLNDTAFLTRLHQKLHLYQRASSNGTNDTVRSSIAANTAANTAAGDLKTYYATRPGLRKYTLGVELDRMDYELILGNGKSTKDKDVIRSYFGVGEDGERMHQDSEGGEEKNQEDTATTEELLIRSANQSLLADLLVALTGSEEDVVVAENVGSNGFFGQDTGDAGSAGLILSGPALCMTSVAESCHFVVDLQCGKVEAVCLLAISIPFHPINDAAAAASSQLGSSVITEVVEDGRLVLARAKVSVRFRPGGEGGDWNDEPTVQYAVQSVTPFHSAAGSLLLQQAAISLAHDQHDPFFQNEKADDTESTDARDRFLLSHHLLSAADSAALLAVSKDHIDKLKGAAEKSSTGFRSALRQLDGVANVSARLGGLSGGFGLTLPSAAQFEAAEREAASCEYAHLPPSSAAFRFPRPNDSPQEEQNLQPTYPRPAVPPPPCPPRMTSQIEAGETSASRPRPLIGGLFMSSLSRLAAAATQPDDQQQQSSWGGVGGGTGLTPPSSPPSANGIARNEHPALYRLEEDEGPPSSGMQEWNEEQRGYTGLTPLASKQTEQQMDHFQESPPPALTSSHFSTTAGELTAAEETENKIDDVEEQELCMLEDGHDRGWSDDELDFEDEKISDHVGDQEEEACNHSDVEKQNTDPTIVDDMQLASLCEDYESKGETFPVADGRLSSPILGKPALHQHSTKIQRVTKTVLSSPLPPPPPPPSSSQQHRAFDEEFVIVLKEKIEAECRQMKETGRVKRWMPLRDDVLVRRRLMEVMISQINFSD